MTQTVDEERTFWDANGVDEQTAKAAIAADESAWSGEVLEKCLEQILPALDSAPHGPKGPRVLDLGCGAGRLAIPIAAYRQHFAITGVDISQAMLDIAQRTIAGSAVRWLLCDGRKLPGELGRIDAAYSMIMLQHIPRAAQASYVRRVAEALVRRGVLRFQWLEGDEKNFLHHSVTEEWIFEQFSEAGMKITAFDRVRPFNNDLDAPNALWVTGVKK